MEKKMTRSCIIIGAGLGGLSAALSLASRGLSVSVFEQNSNPGGKAGSLNTNGYRFDTGPSLLTMPFILKDLIEEAGYKSEDYLTITALNEHCRY
jgi:phytoene dehydrogenase-like protein